MREDLGRESLRSSRSTLRVSDLLLRPTEIRPQLCVVPHSEEREVQRDMLRGVEDVIAVAIAFELADHEIVGSKRGGAAADCSKEDGRRCSRIHVA
jgi:hypothetical protein